MLKIKDNVDLKELEKFGFVMDDEFSFSYYPIYCDREISLEYKDRIIRFSGEWYEDDFDDIDIIYDLIQAGLIEKVEE